VVSFICATTIYLLEWIAGFLVTGNVYNWNSENSWFFYQTSGRTQDQVNMMAFIIANYISQILNIDIFSIITLFFYTNTKHGTIYSILILCALWGSSVFGFGNFGLNIMANLDYQLWLGNASSLFTLLTSLVIVISVSAISYLFEKKKDYI
jgi:hypothetical protein